MSIARRILELFALLAIVGLIPGHEQGVGSVAASGTTGWVVHHKVEVAHMERGPNLVKNPGFESGAANWQTYGNGYVVDTNVARSGTRSIRLEGSTLSAAVQEVRLDQQVAGPIYVSGWSKAQGVTSGCRMQYSLYFDIFFTDGTKDHSPWLCFPGGTHDWHYVERILEPSKPVRSVYIWTMFQTSGAGKAWFDDLAVGQFTGDVRDFDRNKVIYGAPTQRPWEGSSVLSVQSGDGLSLGLTANGGAVSSVSVQGQEQVNPATIHGSGFFVRDVAGGSDFVHLGGTVTQQGSRLVYSGASTDLGLNLTAQFEGHAKQIVIDASLQDTTGQDRAISLYFALPISSAGRTWWQDIRTGYAAGAVTESVFALDTTRRWGDTGWVPNDGFGANGLISHYNFSSLGGAAGAQGVAGLAMAYPMDRPVMSRFAYNASTWQYYVVFELGLSPQARNPGCAHVRFILYHHEPEWGFRAAFDKYVSIYPHFFERRVEEDGIWAAHVELGGIPNIDDFRIRFHSTGNPHVYAEDDALGIYTLRYLTEPWGYWLRPPRTVDTHDYDAVMAYVEQMRSAPAENDRRWADAILSSGVFDAQGRYRYEPSSQAFASHAAAFILSGNPELNIPPYTASKASQSWSEGHKVPYSRPDWGILDGEYIDSFESKGVYANYRNEHFRFSNLPLTFSTSNHRPVLPHIFSSYELAKHIASDIHAMGRYVMGNSLLLRWAFPAHIFDIMGSERGWVINGRFQPDGDSLLNLWRTMSYRKPYAVLQNGDLPSFDRAMVEEYFAYCAFYGIYPSFFTHDGGVTNYWSTPEWYERDRELFRFYIPKIVALNEAGWEPVTHARTDKSALVYIERYGRGESFYLTLRNATDAAQETTVSVDLAAMGLPLSDAFVAAEWITGQALSPSLVDGRLRLTLTVPAKGTRILRLELMGGQLQSMPLSAGWNLVALPGQPISSRATDLFAPLDGQLNRAYIYDAVAGVWLAYQTQVPASSVSDLREGQGVWIHVNGAPTWQMRTTPLSTLTLHLQPGWNLIGYSLAEGQDLAAATAPLGDRLLQVNDYGGEHEASPWSVFLPEMPETSTLTRLEPGRGYWVKVSEACTWTLHSP